MGLVAVKLTVAFTLITEISSLGFEDWNLMQRDICLDLCYVAKTDAIDQFSSALFYQNLMLN